MRQPEGLERSSKGYGIFFLKKSKLSRKTGMISGEPQRLWVERAILNS